MERSKVAIFGAGFVGSTTAQYVVQQELADVVLIDPLEGVPQGRALDMMQSACLLPFDTTVSGSNDAADCAESDVVVITGGVARKPGMSRDDLLAINAGIVGQICEAVRAHAPSAIVIMVTNPLDAMTQLAYTRLGFAPQRVMGMAGMLDSARLRYFVAAELGVSLRDVDAMVLGGHGDDMVPLIRYATVSGIAVEELLPRERLEAIIARTRQGGAEIVQLLKTGSAHYAPGVATAAMVRAILHDEHRLLPVSAWCSGEYGIHQMFVGVPAIIGRDGVERVVELALTEDEAAQLQQSAEHVLANLQRLDLVDAASSTPTRLTESHKDR